MSALITQLVSDEPTIIFLGMGDVYERDLQRELRQAGAIISSHNILEFFQNNKSVADMDVAYKIVCCLNAQTLTLSHVEKITTALRAFQAKTTVVVMVSTSIKPASQEIDLITQWRIAGDAQEKIIGLLSKEIERARMLFCQDLCQTKSDGDLPSWKALVADSTEIIDPQMWVYPCDPKEVVPVLVQQLLLPLPQPSLFLRGAHLSTQALFEQVVQALNQVQMRTIAVRTIACSERPLTPFFVEERIIAPSPTFIWQLALRLAENIPSLPQPNRAGKIGVVSAPTPTPTPPPVVLDEVSSATPVLRKTRDLKKAPEVRAATQSSKHESVDISAELQKIFSATRVNDTVERVTSIARVEKKTVGRGKRKKILFWGGLFAIGLAVFTLFSIGVYVASVSLLKLSLQKSLQEPGLIAVFSGTTNQRDVVQFPQLLAQFVSLQNNVYGGLLDSPATVHAQQYVEIATLLPSAIEELVTAQNATKSLYTYVVGNELGDVEQLSNKLTTAAQNSYEQLSKLQAVFKVVGPTLLSNKTTLAQQSLNSIEQSLLEIRRTLVAQQQLQAVLPQLLGEPTSRTYALVLQNSQELRPTGGFIQAIALITFANGNLVETKVYSSYELDQKLLGTVQPPAEIQRYLGEKQWFLRDSNWDPHFPNTAAKIAWFIDETQDVQVDGVVAINLESLRIIIDQMGPIEVPEYNEVITGKNLLERTEFHSEVVIAPDSTQRDYSAILLEKVLAKATKLPAENIIPTLTAVQNMLSEQEVALAVFTNAEEEVLANLGWSGGLVRPTCPAQFAQDTCVTDYIYPVEANVGVNKANAYITRLVEHEVQFVASGAAHTHTLRLENTARSNSWPKGSYKNYLRLLLPNTAIVSEVMVNGERLPANQWNSYEESGLRVLGFEAVVPIQQQTEIIVNYITPGGTHDNPFSYTFFLQKQPGVRETPTIVRIHPPAGLKPARIAPNAVVSQGVVEFKLKQNEHVFVGIEFN